MNSRDALTAAVVQVAKNVDDLSRRQSSLILSGTVHEIDGNKVRLKLLEEDTRTGKPFLSPWVQLQELAGSSASNMPVAIGDPLRLLSPGGEIGSQSLAIRDSHTDTAQNPEQNKEFVLTHGGSAIRMDEGGIVLSIGGSSLAITPGQIAAVSDMLTHNSKDVGETHIHTGVEPGIGLSSVPA